MVPSDAAARHEVLRRLDARGAGGDPRVRDLVLRSPLAGRGPREVSATSERDLLRVCLAALSRWCELDPAPRAAGGASRGRSGPVWRRGSAPVVVGDGATADALRRRTAGLRLRGTPVVLVVAAPLDEMAAGLWRRRVDAGSGVRWHRLWAGFTARDRLPGALDPAAAYRLWRGRTDRVHLLVTGPGAAEVDVAGLLGVDLPPGADRLDAVDTDLLRRLNQVLATRPESVRRRPYADPLAAAFTRPWAGAPGVPDDALAWAVARGEALADDLARATAAPGGPPLGGDVALVVPSTGARARSVPVAATLERALDVLGRLGALDGRGRPSEGGEPWRAP